jgi:hypothetical protein
LLHAIGEETIWQKQKASHSFSLVSASGTTHTTTQQTPTKKIGGETIVQQNPEENIGFKSIV